MSLPAIMLLLLAGVATIAVVTARLACQAEARDSALSVARGQSGDSPNVRTSDDGPFVRATAERRLRVATVSCSATALREPGPA